MHAIRSTQVSDLRSCQTEPRQQLVGENAGDAKWDDPTLTTKKSTGVIFGPGKTVLVSAEEIQGLNPQNLYTDNLAPMIVQSYGRDST